MGGNILNYETYPDSNEVWFRFSKKCCSTTVKSLCSHLYWTWIFRILTHTRYLAGRRVRDVWEGVSLCKSACVYMNELMCSLAYVKVPKESIWETLVDLSLYEKGLWFKALILLSPPPRTSSPILSRATPWLLYHPNISPQLSIVLVKVLWRGFSV